MSVLTSLSQGRPLDRRYLSTLQTPERALLEAAVRSAAIQAASLRDMSIPDGVLNFIVASSDWTMPRERLMARAAEMAEHVISTPPPINLYGSASAAELRAYCTAMGRHFGMPPERVLALLADSEGSAGVTSARFDRMSGADAAFLTQMRDVAIRHGLHWAADRPDVLRMGEAAIQLFARTGFTRDSFERLERAGFNRQQVLRLVERAERSGQNANELARTTEDTIRILGGGDPQRERNLRAALDAFHDSPTDADAWLKLDTILRRYETEGTPEQREQAKKQREAEEKILRAETALTATATTETTVTTTAATETAEARAARIAKEQAEAAERAALAALQGEPGAPSSAPAPAPGTSPSSASAPTTGAPSSPTVVAQPAPQSTPTGTQQAQAITPQAAPSPGR